MTAFVKLLLLVVGVFSGFRQSVRIQKKWFRQISEGSSFCWPKITTFLKIKLLVSNFFCQTKCQNSNRLSDRSLVGFRQLPWRPSTEVLGLVFEGPRIPKSGYILHVRLQVGCIYDCPPKEPMAHAATLAINFCGHRAQGRDVISWPRAPLWCTPDLFWHPPPSGCTIRWYHELLNSD